MNYNFASSGAKTRKKNKKEQQPTLKDRRMIALTLTGIGNSTEDFQRARAIYEELPPAVALVKNLRVAADDVSIFIARNIFDDQATTRINVITHVADQFQHNIVMHREVSEGVARVIQSQFPEARIVVKVCLVQEALVLDTALPNGKPEKLIH